MRTSRLLHRVERTFWVAGALLSGFCTGLYVEAHFYQALENRRLEEALRSPVPPPYNAPRERRQRTHPQRAIGSLVGRLEIPRLKLAAIVLEGSDSHTLSLGIGRIPQTADPGQPGNVVLGGHRDTFFRPLRRIRPGDEVKLTTPHGSYAYKVEWTSVVNPKDTYVLRPTSDPSLTLVTCYPFYYIGPAPRRFIVRARQVEPRVAMARTDPSAQTEVN